MVTVILLVGLFGNDIVTDMVNFTFIYGIPLFVFIVIYSATVAIEVRKFKTQKRINKSQLLIISSKILVAVIPMFYLNNTGAHLLSLLRLN